MRKKMWKEGIVGKRRKIGCYGNRKRAGME